MTQIDILTNALTKMYESSDKVKRIEYWKSDFGITDSNEVRAVLEKLKSDGFALDTDGDRISYQISIDGRLFKEYGGYRQRKEDDDLKREEIRLKNRQDRLNQKLLVIGAFGAAIGALGLVIWEIWKYFHLKEK